MNAPTSFPRPILDIAGDLSIAGDSLGLSEAVHRSVRDEVNAFFDRIRDAALAKRDGTATEILGEA